MAKQSIKERKLRQAARHKKWREKNKESLKLKNYIYNQKNKDPEKKAVYQRWYYSDDNPKIKHVKKLRKIRNKKYYQERQNEKI